MVGKERVAAANMACSNKPGGNEPKNYALTPSFCYCTVAGTLLFQVDTAFGSDDAFAIADGNRASFQMPLIVCKEQDRSTAIYPVLPLMSNNIQNIHGACMC